MGGSSILPILNLIEKASAKSDPRQALKDLLADCVRETQSESGRLYLLDLAQAAYIQLAAIGPHTHSRINLLSGGDDDVLLCASIQKHRIINAEPPPDPAQPTSRSSQTRSRLIVPMIRDHTCLGVFDFDSTEPHHFNTQHEDAMRVAAIVGTLLREKDDVLNLFRELQVPVDYHQGFEEFLDELMLLITAASKSSRVILRELRDDDTLFCLNSFGFSDRSDSDLHISPLSDYPVFAEVLANKSAVTARRRDGAAAEDALRRLRLDNIESFIILPVLVGQEVFGTLSFAFDCDHEYTVMERQGFQTIANATGIAIANYRNFHLAEDRLFSEAQVAAAITTVDVAQSARHEARNHLHDAQETLALLLEKSGPLSGKIGEELRNTINKMSTQLGGVETALQKIKTITKPPEKDKRVTRLDELWEDAFALTVGRLAQQQIEWNVRGNAMVNVARDYIKTAFLNLIINSIDAFKGAKKKGRQIEITIESTSEKASDVVMRYMDNATGIDPSRLTPAFSDMPRSAADIFQPGVTSKTDGSGYGLYLVRKILADHKGSISLLDYRNGIVFQIKLPQANTNLVEGKDL